MKRDFSSSLFISIFNGEFWRVLRPRRRRDHRRVVGRTVVGAGCRLSLRLGCGRIGVTRTEALDPYANPVQSGRAGVQRDSATEAHLRRWLQE